MSILGNIFGKIFPSSHPAASGPASPGTAPGSTPAATLDPQPIPEVDVEAILVEKARQNPEKLNWRTSIVDLMKLLGLDSSLADRKQLAKELSYASDTNDSATMNVWLHKQVMAKLAANGGRVPADLT